MQTHVKWTLFLLFSIIYFIICLLPIIHTQIHSENSIECSDFYGYCALVTTHLCSLPLVLPGYFAFLKEQRTNPHPGIIVIAAVVSTLYQVFCLFLRINTKQILDKTNIQTCSTQFISSFCVSAVVTVTVVSGAVWLVILARFLQYCFKSTDSKMFLLRLVTYWSGAYLAVVVMNSRSDELDTNCMQSLPTVSIRTAVNIGAFAIVYSFGVTCNQRGRAGIQMRRFCSLFFKFFVIVNVYWYVQGASWLEGVKIVDSTCLTHPTLFLLGFFAYELLVLSMIVVFIASKILFKCRVLSPNQLLLSRFLRLVEGFVEENEEETVIANQQTIREAEQRAALLNSTDFEEAGHSKSFQENSICPICWENFPNVSRVTYFPTCNHIFHSGCLKKWIQNHNTCPTCRRVIMPVIEMVDATHHNINNAI